MRHMKKCRAPNERVWEPEKANGHSLPRDSWKKLLGVVSESGQVTSLFGDSEGVVISFRYYFRSIFNFGELTAFENSALI